MSFNLVMEKKEKKSVCCDDYVSACLTWLFQLDKCRKLIQIAEQALEEATNYFYGIEACNEVLDGYGHGIGPKLKHECLCLRAALLLKVI